MQKKEVHLLSFESFSLISCAMHCRARLPTIDFAFSRSHFIDMHSLSFSFRCFHIYHSLLQLVLLIIPLLVELSIHRGYLALL